MDEIEYRDYPQPANLRDLLVGKMPGSPEFNECLELLQSLERQYEALFQLFSVAVAAMNDPKKLKGEESTMRIQEGVIAFRAVDGVWHLMPSFRSIAQAVAKDIDFYKEKVREGFDTISIAPTGLAFKEIYKLVARFLSTKIDPYFQISDQSGIEDNEVGITSYLNHAVFNKNTSPVWSVALRKRQIGGKAPNVDIKKPGIISVDDTRDAITIAAAKVNQGEAGMTLEAALIMYLDALSQKPLPIDSYHNVIVLGTRNNGEYVTIIFDQGDPDSQIDPGLRITNEAGRNLVPEDMIQKVIPIVIQFS